MNYVIERSIAISCDNVRRCESERSRRDVDSDGVTVIYLYVVRFLEIVY